jgi:hypothetical protein
MRIPRLPKRLERRQRVTDARNCPAHRAWVRSHHCCVRGCSERPVECAHIRHGTDGALGKKPSDRWTISLCWLHHREQHDLGEASFEEKHDLDLFSLAIEFTRRSPHRSRLD